MPIQFTESDIEQFTGTMQYYRSSIFTKDIVHTDGVQFIAERGAAWCVDLIVSHQSRPKVRKEEFQVWEFVVNEQSECRAICTDANEHVITWQQIPYTDLTFSFKLFVEFGSVDGITPAWVILLPSEH